MHIKSKFAFFISLFFILFGPLFIPKLHLFYFSPYLVICLYQHSKLALLWRAFACGVLLDLLSSGPFFGFSSLEFCCICWLLHGQIRNFFEDKLSTLPLMTFLFSFLLTCTSLVLTLFFGNHYTLSCTWIITNLVSMPFIDATYALLVFSLPFRLTYHFRKLRLLNKS